MFYNKPKTDRKMSTPLGPLAKHASVYNLAGGRLQGIAGNLKTLSYELQAADRQLMNAPPSKLKISIHSDIDALFERLAMLAKLVKLHGEEMRTEYRCVNNLNPPRPKRPPKVMERW